MALTTIGYYRLKGYSFHLIDPEKVRAESAKEKMRGNLLRAVSHDFRTPLTTIYGSSTTIIENYDHLKKEQFTANCVTFCDAVKEAGYETMIYANMKWMAFTLDLNELAGYKKWYADYEPLPQCPYEFSMWQYTEKGKVPGIEGNVDLNLCFENFGS